MSKKEELLNLIKKLKDLNLRELEFLKQDALDEKTVKEFIEKKNKLRKTIDNHIKQLELNSEEKSKIKNIFIELLEYEQEIGNAYKQRVLNVRDGLFYINTERKLRETYGKGGMSFLMDEDKNLK